MAVASADRATLVALGMELRAGAKLSVLSSQNIRTNLCEHHTYCVCMHVTDCNRVCVCTYLCAC